VVTEGALGVLLAFGGGAHGPLAKLGTDFCVVRAVRALLDSGAIDQVAVVAAPSDVDALEQVCRGASGVAVFSRPPDVGTDTLLVVHDVARPLAPPELVSAVIAGARSHRQAVAPVLPVTDTMRRLDPNGFLSDAVDRDGLRIVQAPIAVPAALLPAAGLDGITRAVELVHRLGPIITISGDPRAIELRTAWDRKLAESMMAP
jgi:2-C-methyl-D-erythritol 4-phosphate cytidylyltransferase